MTDEDFRKNMDYYQFKYGKRRFGRVHRPVPNENRVCVAVDPATGRICGRAVNHYEPVGGTARWRHNPRPYGRAGAA